MSTINVDNVLPQSNPRVKVGGADIEYDANRNLTIGDVISDSMSAYDNTVVGNNSLSLLTSGTNNTAVGAYVMSSCTTGASNVGMGHAVLSSITTGSSNTAIGSGAMASSVTGINNSAFGTNALTNGASGNNNVAVGSYAGLSASGNNNVYIGYLSAQLQTSGNNNITIGNNASNSTITASDEITLGNSSNAVLRCAVTTITSLSDERDKKDIKDLPVGLDFLNGLRPVQFVWNEREKEGRKKIKDFGFIAQDLKKSQEDAKMADVLKLVYEANPEKLEASYGKLIPILVKAVQELSAKVAALESAK